MPDSLWLQVLIAGTVFRLMVGPLLVVAHELGHAAMALLLTDGPVSVIIGRGRGPVRSEVGRLSVELAGILRPFGLHGSTTWEPDRPSLAQTAAFFLSGPIISLGLAVGLGFLTYASTSGTTLRLLLWMSAMSATWLTLMTLLPLRTPDPGWKSTSPSDALIVLRRLRAGGEGNQPSETHIAREVT